ncbi:MAG: hypothetical protein ABL958_19360 [Bdellovibrionia bacterium]
MKPLFVFSLCTILSLASLAQEVRGVRLESLSLEARSWYDVQYYSPENEKVYAPQYEFYANLVRQAGIPIRTFSAVSATNTTYNPVGLMTTNEKDCIVRQITELGKAKSLLQGQGKSLIKINHIQLDIDVRHRGVPKEIVNKFAHRTDDYARDHQVKSYTGSEQGSIILLPGISRFGDCQIFNADEMIEITKIPRP